jgi:S-adenosylmethionine:tRNA ribosyltransferase-isomerase
LFLYPRHENHKEVPFIGNGIVTNFHQPESTLAMLIASLVGIDFWKKMYSHAIEQKYRFFSYGDSSFILFKRD